MTEDEQKTYAMLGHYIVKLGLDVDFASTRYSPLYGEVVDECEDEGDGDGFDYRSKTPHWLKRKKSEVGQESESSSAPSTSLITHSCLFCYVSASSQAIRTEILQMGEC